MEAHDPRFEAVLTRAASHPKARSLPVDAFILAPVQRLARYPMLVQAIQSRTQPEAEGFAELEEVRKCWPCLQGPRLLD